jgi:hypothetical protein
MNITLPSSNLSSGIHLTLQAIDTGPLTDRAFDRRAPVSSIVFQFCTIDVIAKDAFANLTSVSYLEFFFSTIDRIEPGAFDGLLNLKEL